MTETEPKKPRKKAEPKIPKQRINTKDWRKLPLDNWTTATVLVMFADLNRERFGVTEYLPFRNWNVERGMIKRELDRYGANVMRDVFTEAFETHTPTRDYPILTAGFVISYMQGRIIARKNAEQAEKVRIAAEKERVETVTIDHAELEAWL
ncbi:hypothetical protein J2T13_000211 [Paenibacillus sp. DS2015]|uniref:hypothetical protein n=1 Tax=Paenibacillus sp. DS2015 TaxID=3373917 RepID=UPI003D1B2DA7